MKNEIIQSNVHRKKKFWAEKWMRKRLGYIREYMYIHRLREGRSTALHRVCLPKSLSMIRQSILLLLCVRNTISEDDSDLHMYNTNREDPRWRNSHTHGWTRDPLHHHTNGSIHIYIYTD